jgi:hypothetical protein
MVVRMVVLMPSLCITFGAPLLQVGRCASDLPKDFAPHPSIVKLCAKRRCVHTLARFMPHDGPASCWLHPAPDVNQPMQHKAANRLWHSC